MNSVKPAVTDFAHSAASKTKSGCNYWGDLAYKAGKAASKKTHEFGEYLELAEKWKMIWEYKYFEELSMRAAKEEEDLQYLIKASKEFHESGAVGNFFTSLMTSASTHMQNAKKSLNETIYGKPIQLTDVIEDSSVFNKKHLNTTYLRCHYNDHNNGAEELTTWGWGTYEGHQPSLVPPAKTQFSANGKKIKRHQEQEKYQATEPKYRKSVHEWYRYKKFDMPYTTLVGRWAQDANGEYSFAIKDYSLVNLWILCVESIKAGFQQGRNADRWKIKDIDMSKIQMTASNGYGGANYPIVLYQEKPEGYQKFSNWLSPGSH